jgi:putative DNA methylase
MNYRKKLIEVALPLDAINKASVREKSIRHGHPSTLHLWWARRPLAAARAVIFAQMVDDPSTYLDELRNDKAMRLKAEALLKSRRRAWDKAGQNAGLAAFNNISAPNPGLEPSLDQILVELERERLFEIIEELVQWENTTNEIVLQKARDEIWKSWRRACAEHADHPRARELFDRHKLPAFHDPFAGGGSLPLEAQRLGLEAYASDLNPVAVLINKAMIEIPPKFANRPPVRPVANGKQIEAKDSWQGTQGLAEDVRYYGQWMRDEAEKRIGHLYPKVKITAEMAAERPDLKPYVGRSLTVIAWLWARTVRSPNPAFADVDVPLVSTFMLSTREGKEAYVEPVIKAGGYSFSVKVGPPADPKAVRNGTKLSRGANFQCLMSGSPITGDYIKAEGMAGRMGARLMAIVAEGDNGRVYLPPLPEHEEIARKARSSWKPENELVGKCRDQLPLYGMNTFADIFTDRQLVALTTFSDLVEEARELIKRDAVAAGFPDDGKKLESGGAGAMAYAEAVSTYLALTVSRQANRSCTISFWDSTSQKIQQAFGRQALPMTWDFCETNIFSNSSGNWLRQLDFPVKLIEILSTQMFGHSLQQDAKKQILSIDKIISTDPPYYDNICYADLSDFFYIWLRHSLKTVFPDLFATLEVPKGDELIASKYRHGSAEKAEDFFLNGMIMAMRQLAGKTHPAFPVTIYYAFKQSETKDQEGTASTGWETFLEAVIRAGFAITGTWPIRTEYTGNLKKNVSALASSIVLVCRPRTGDAPVATRREFVSALKNELPVSLEYLQRSNIAPVDLAQAAIGPGMAIYTRYAKVIDVRGNPLSVREALALINETLDEVLAEQEGDFDADTRWAVAWFEQFGFEEGEFGIAETLSKAKNTSILGLADAGVLLSRKGTVRLFRPEELPEKWNPLEDPRLTVWEMVHHLIRALEKGEEAAAGLLALLGSRADPVRELAYRLYTICERKKWAHEALAYNSLVQSWPEIERLARERSRETQQTIFGEE